jgi:hypothetical protein
MLQTIDSVPQRATSRCIALPLVDWHEAPSFNQQSEAVATLERGDVLVLPDLPFVLSAAESTLLRPDCVKPGTKTIKYDPSTRRVWGLAQDADAAAVQSMLGRYADAAGSLVEALIPRYAKSLTRGNTSFRPVEALGRAQSKRHDDTLLHVDAFPSRPTHGTRILRVFTNIHPGDKPRVWRVGEPFEQVAAHLVGITKSERSLADHYMLKLHDLMKFDAQYQRNAPQQTISFRPGATWMVFTDQVSHAAMSGQHALEQTFTLSIDGMLRPEQAPLRILERLKGGKLQ